MHFKRRDFSSFRFFKHNIVVARKFINQVFISLVFDYFLRFDSNISFSMIIFDFRHHDRRLFSKIKKYHFIRFFHLRFSFCQFFRANKANIGQICLKIALFGPKWGKYRLKSCFSTIFRFCAHLSILLDFRRFQANMSCFHRFLENSRQVYIRLSFSPISGFSRQIAAGIKKKQPHHWL